jgi:hypothetical protein
MTGKVNSGEDGEICRDCKPDYDRWHLVSLVLHVY